jgi:DNA helicase HerA-like ATPase
MIDSFFRLLEQPLIWLSHRRAQRACGNHPRELGLGELLDSGEPVHFSARDLARHAYILGSTGCGKTTLILKLIEQDLKRRHSVVVVDLRGDLVEGALALCQRLEVDPARVTLLDLREKDLVVGFNPLSGAGEPYIRALHVLDVVASEAESWGVQLEESLRSALLLLAAAAEPLTKLEAVFYDRRFRSELLAQSQDEALVGFWQRFDELSPDKQQAWALPVLNKVTSLLSVPTLRAILSGAHGIDLGKHLSTKGSVLLVSLAVDELHRSSRMLGSLVVSAISREMMARVNVSESKRNPVRLYVDEFENMASESFEGLIAEGRRFGLTLVLSHQTLSQLPGRLRSVVRNNVGIQLIFQCGFEDAKLLARELPTGIGLAELRALEVGQAYVMLRDGTADAVQFHPPLDAPAASVVAEYRLSVLRAHQSKTESTPAATPTAKPKSKRDSAAKEEWL